MYVLETSRILGRPKPVICLTYVARLVMLPIPLREPLANLPHDPIGYNQNKLCSVKDILVTWKRYWFGSNKLLFRNGSLAAPGMVGRWSRRSVETVKCNLLSMPVSKSGEKLGIPAQPPTPWSRRTASKSGMVRVVIWGKLQRSSWSILPSGWEQDR